MRAVVARTRQDKARQGKAQGLTSSQPAMGRRHEIKSRGSNHVYVSTRLSHLEIQGGILLRLQSGWLADHSISSQLRSKISHNERMDAMQLKQNKVWELSVPQDHASIVVSSRTPYDAIYDILHSRREIVPRPKKDASIMYIYIFPKTPPLA